MEIVTSFEESDLLINGANESIENEPNKQAGEYFSIFYQIH